jgi:hypothetical protein
MDTKIEVVKKADASEVEKTYMTKQNTLTVIKLSDEKNKDLIYAGIYLRTFYNSSICFKTICF